MKTFFKTDENTKKDLDIFTKNKNDDSVFSIFNSCKTQGGIQRLIDFIENPLCEVDALKRKTEIIKFISDNDLSLVLNYHQFDFIEHYLKLSRIPLRDNILDSVFNVLSYRIKPNNSYYNIRMGIEQFICLVKQLKLYLEKLENTDPPQFIVESKKNFEWFIKILKSNKLTALDKKLNFKDVNRLDSLIRRKEKRKIRELLDSIYTLECYLSVSKTIKKHNFSIPVYDNSPQPQIEIQSLFHPFISDPVANDIQLIKDENLCFLTGPNMAGKSTFLKSVGLSVYLAHIGFPVPAKYMRTTIFNGLITTINLPDNINMGYSHYYSEVKRVKETVNEILDRKNVLVIFDELFRGTNVKDAYEASYRIIDKLSQIKDCLFFISTHINEIAEMFKSKSIIYKYFDSTLVNDSPVYDYELKDGISTERLGMQIIKNEKIIDLLDEIINRQKKKAIM